MKRILLAIVMCSQITFGGFPTSLVGKIYVRYFDDSTYPEYVYYETDSSLVFLDYEETGIHSYSWNSSIGRQIDFSFEEYFDYTYVTNFSGTFLMDSVVTGEFFVYDESWDLDDNGIADGLQIKNGTLPNTNPKISLFLDQDGDGLNLYDELTYGTDRENVDSDEDGLSDGDEISIHSTNPNASDSDNDGFDDNEEISLNLDPNTSNTNIFNTVRSKMKDLRVGSQTFDVSNGTATIRMYVDESSDLTSSWTNTHHVLEVDIPTDQDTMFYRFRMD